MPFSLFQKEDYYEEVSQFNHYEVHSHILPGVDDGAVSIEMALEMIDAEIQQGVKRLILTPHIRKDDYDYKKIMRQYEELQIQVYSSGRKIALYLGSEIYYDGDTINKLQNGQAYTLAGGDYVLIEFSIDVLFEYLNNAVNDLMMCGYLPIIAHAERYDCLMKDTKRIKELVKKGAYIQVNAGSVLNHPKRRRLIRLIKDGDIHFIGTDCHRTYWRPVCLEEAARYLAKHIGKEDYCRIFFSNPQKLVGNKLI